jgi:hypothetical protein
LYNLDLYIAGGLVYRLLFHMIPTHPRKTLVPKAAKQKKVITKKRGSNG